MLCTPNNRDQAISAIVNRTSRGSNAKTALSTARPATLTRSSALHTSPNRAPSISLQSRKAWLSHGMFIGRICSAARPSRCCWLICRPQWAGLAQAAKHRQSKRADTAVARALIVRRALQVGCRLSTRVAICAGPEQAGAATCRQRSEPQARLHHPSAYVRAKRLHCWASQCAVHGRRDFTKQGQ